MKITVNNRETETSATLLSELIEDLGLPPTGVAVAIDRHLVPHNEWNVTSLKEGASITVIKAAFGG